MRKPLLLAGSGLLALALGACSGDDAGFDDDAAGKGGGGSGGAANAGKAGATGGKAGSSSAGSAGNTANTGGASGSSSAGGPGAGGRGGGGQSGGAPGAGSGGQAAAGGGGNAAGSAGASAAGGTSGGSAGSAGSDAGEAGTPGSGGADDGGAAGSSGTSGASGSGNAGSSGGGSLDPFGIREIYPTAPNGAEWTSEHWEGEDYTISGRSDPNDPSGLSGMRGDGTLSVEDGVLTMSGSQPRIYIYEPDSGPWQNVEVTAYYQRIEDAGEAYAGLVIGVRSGEDGHTDSNACDAHTYYARVRNDGAFDFEKELEHPASSTQARVQPDDAWPDGEVPRSTWIGFKFVIYNVSGGDVKFEAYRDMTNGEDGGDWELVNETVDDGGWFVDTSCSEHDPDGGESDMIVTEGGTTFIRNTEVDEALYRWVSVREIEAP